MRRVALTGGIATGKSYVLTYVGERGVPAIDADEVVHRLFGPGGSLGEAIAAEFGDGFLNPDGSVNRPALGQRVFAEARARLRLEAIVHPIVYDEIAAWFEHLHRPFAVACIPLLYETGREMDFDVVIVTACSPERQMERLDARGLSREEARQRLAAQVPTDEKVRRADFVIWTDGSKSETRRQTDEILEWLDGTTPAAAGENG